jgi:hypothetical protein
MSVYVSRDEGFADCPLFDCSLDRETLTHSEPDEAIEAALDAWLSPKCNILEHLRTAVGETLIVHGFTRLKLLTNEWSISAEGILESLIERLDEEYGGDEPTETTDAMETAAQALSLVMHKEYRVWQCEATHEAVVNVEAWIRENRPDWLEPVSAA